MKDDAEIQRRLTAYEQKIDEMDRTILELEQNNHMLEDELKSLNKELKDFRDKKGRVAGVMRRKVKQLEDKLANTQKLLREKVIAVTGAKGVTYKVVYLPQTEWRRIVAHLDRVERFRAVSEAIRKQL